MLYKGIGIGRSAEKACSVRSPLAVLVLLAFLILLILVVVLAALIVLLTLVLLVLIGIHVVTSLRHSSRVVCPI